jgi:MarR family transcriptional regulator, transcriptional regulator for hemolysin
MTSLAEISSAPTQRDPLGFLIVDAARLMRAAFEQRIAEAGLGLTAGEARALINIADLEGNRQLDIAARMGVEPMTLCAYLDKLQALGLIERHKCSADRRAKRIILTPVSDDMLRRIRAEFETIVEQATTGMPETEKRNLAASLTRLNRNLQASLPPSSGSNESR